MLKKRVNYKLKRDLGLVNVVFAGVGIILGAGIYTLIGLAAGETGNSVWLSFLIASIVAGFTGLSYAELSSRFKDDSGEYDYTKRTFGKKIAWLMSMLIIFTGIVSASVVALGFAGYLTAIFPIGYLLTTILIIIVMSFINFYGISESNRFNIIATTIEFIGLIIIIVLGIKNIGTVNLLEMPNGFMGLFKAGALVFFSFMGFETIIKLTEETKKPEKTIPLAIVISIFVTAIVYMLVSISAVSIISSSELAQSSSPLADVAAKSLGGIAFIVLGIIALFSTSNTILLTMLTTSRMIYGMGKQKVLPKFFSKIDKNRRTPHVAIIVTGIITILLALIGNIEFVADLTTALLFITFAIVNLSLIFMRYKEDKIPPFRSPLNIGKFSITAALGIITSLIMLVFSLINIFS